LRQLNTLAAEGTQTAQPDNTDAPVPEIEIDRKELPGTHLDAAAHRLIYVLLNTNMR